MTFSEHLLFLRTKGNFTQEAAAEGAGLSLRAYQNYERGLREPKMTALIALADFYNLPLDELVCRDYQKDGTEQRSSAEREAETVRPTIGR